MLIGLSGLARSGKDTCADFLVATNGYTKASFASSIKEAVKIIFGWDDHRIEDFKEMPDPIFNITPRIALRTLGTDWGRNTICKDIWILSLYSKIQAIEKCVISDVRFVNEASFIKDKGGLIISIIREKVENFKDINDLHPSEREVFDIRENMADAHITNNENRFDELYSNLQGVINKYCIEKNYRRRTDGIFSNATN